MNPTTKIDFGENLRYFLSKRNMSQAQLARMLGANPISVNRWTKNVTRPDYETLCEIAVCLRVRIEDLFFRGAIPSKEETK